MSRDPGAQWHLDEGDFPENGSGRDKLEFAARYAILAPSGHNTQPWHFRLTDRQLLIYADRTRSLPVVDPDDRELTISCAAAAGTARVALRYFGFSGDIELLPDSNSPDLLAAINLGSSYTPSPCDNARFQAITDRRTTRLAFDDQPIPTSVISDVNEAAAEWQVETKLVGEADRREAIAKLVSDADREQYSDPNFRDEITEWMHSRHSGSRDGISSASYGLPDILSGAASLLIRTFDVGKGIAAQDKKLAESSPLLVVFATATDQVTDWLRAGIGHIEAVLSFTAAGLKTAYLNQPIEVPSYRPRLKVEANLSGVPQLLMRVGSASEVPHSVRRPLSEVMLQDRTAT